MRSTLRTLARMAKPYPETGQRAPRLRWPGCRAIYWSRLRLSRKCERGRASDLICDVLEAREVNLSSSENDSESKVVRSDAEWRTLLTPQQYHVLREKGTERPFTGLLTENHETGNYHCAAC